jgi:hypothetical protein
MYRGFGFVFSKLRCDIRALWSSDTRVWDLVLKGSDEASSLVELLSSTVDLIEGHVDATATNRSIWGGGGLVGADRHLFPLPQAGATWVRV